MSRIEKLFERRIFTPAERAAMKELYSFGKLFAERIEATVPMDMHRDIAIVKIKGVLAACETAVALNPVCDKQVDMAFDARSHVAGESVGGCDARPLDRRWQELREENSKLMAENQLLRNQPGFARR